MTLSVTARGSSGRNTAGETSYPLSPSGTIPAGSMAVLAIAYDNSGGGGADPYASISDDAGNTWTSRVNSLNDPSTANNGNCLRIFTSLLTAQLTTTNVITVSYGSNTTVARAFALWQVSGTTGQGLYVTGAQATGSSTAPTITTGSIGSGHVCIGAMSQQNVGAVTADADTTAGSWGTQQAATIGTSTTGMGVASQYKVTTAAGAQTYNLTLGTSATWCIGWVEISEAATVTSDVTSAASALLLRTRDVTSTAAVSDTVTRDVTSSAAIATPAQYYVGSFALPSSTGSFNVTGVPFQPTWIRFWGNALTGDGEVTTGGNQFTNNVGFGAWVAGAASQANIDLNSGTYVRGWTANDTAAVWMLGSASTPTVDAVIWYLNSLSNGFTINLGQIGTRAGTIVNFDCGDDPNVFIGQFQVPATTGPQTLPSLPFQPSLALFITNGSTTTPPGAISTSVAPYTDFSLGAADGVNQWVTASEWDGAVGEQYQRTDHCVAVISAGAVLSQASLTAVGASSITLNWDVVGTGGPNAWVFVLFLGGSGYKVGALTQPSSTGTQQIGTGLSPIGTQFASTMLPASTSIQAGPGTGATTDTGVYEAMMVGAMANTPNRGYMSNAFFWVPPAANWDYFTLNRSSCISLDDYSGSYAARADWSAFSGTSRSYTLNWFLIADAKARQVCYTAFGDPVSPRRVSRDVTSVAAITSAGAVVTRDVTSFAAVLDTGITRDVTTAASVLLLRTRDVTSTAAASDTVTRDVTSLAAVLDTGITRDVTTTAAASAPVSRDVTSAGAASIAGILRSVTSAAAVSISGIVRDVTSLAAASAPVARDVTTVAAALIVGIVRNVTSAASVLLTPSRDVTSAAAALIAGLTRDVTSTAAASIAGYTRDVTSVAAAQIAGYTRDVTSIGAAAISGITRDVTTTAAVLLTPSRDVTSAASTLLMPSRDVTSVAAATAPAHRDVGSSAAIDVIGQASRDVTTQAATAAFAVRDVTSASAVQISGYTRDVTSQASALLIPSRDVTTVAAVLLTPSRDVTSAASMLLNPNRDVSTTAAMQLSPSRDVTSAAATLLTPGRDVATAAALNVTGAAQSDVTTAAAASVPAHRDITSAAALNVPAQVTRDVTTAAAIDAAGIPQADVATQAAVARVGITRDVGTAGAASLTASRDVASAAAVGQSAQRDVLTLAALAAVGRRDVQTGAAVSTGPQTVHRDVLTSAAVDVEGIVQLYLGTVAGAPFATWASGEPAGGWVAGAPEGWSVSEPLAAWAGADPAAAWDAGIPIGAWAGGGPEP